MYKLGQALAANRHDRPTLRAVRRREAMPDGFQCDGASSRSALAVSDSDVLESIEPVTDSKPCVRAGVEAVKTGEHRNRRRSLAAAVAAPRDTTPHHDESEHTRATPLSQREVEAVEVVERVHVQSTSGDERASTAAIVDRPGSDEAALYRVLSHRLRQEGTARALVVTSPERAEGKTTCATNLAIAFAEDGTRKVLLIDAHVRTPRLGTLLGLSDMACFYAQLCKRRRGDQIAWQVAEVQTDHVGQGRLHVLPIAARTTPDDAVLAWLPVVAAIDELRQADYDAIIIDAAPVLGNADVSLLVGLCDGYILTAWAHRTRGTSLVQTTEQLGRDKFLGAVLLGT